MPETIKGLRGEELKLLLKLGGSGKTMFTTEKAQALTDLSPDRLNSLLYHLTQKQWLKRLERGTYLIVPLEAGLDREWSENRFVMASYLVEPYAISYWSALSHWNLTEQLPRAVFVQTTRRKGKREKTVLGVPFVFDDGEDPHFHDFLEWHGLYKVWLNREQTYRDLLGRQSLPEQLRRVIATA